MFSFLGSSDIVNWRCTFSNVLNYSRPHYTRILYRRYTSVVSVHFLQSTSCLKIIQSPETRYVTWISAKVISRPHLSICLHQSETKKNDNNWTVISKIWSILICILRGNKRSFQFSQNIWVPIIRVGIGSLSWTQYR